MSTGAARCPNAGLGGLLVEAAAMLEELRSWTDAPAADEARFSKLVPALIERLQQAARDQNLRELAPDEQTAINLMFDAWSRLTQLGWREASYCPKDGREFMVIEPGCARQHRCIYRGTWPDGHWWILDDDDEWPSYPALFKEVTPREASGNG